MRITCSHCSRVSDFSGERPRFCGHCGSKHAAPTDPQAATLPPAFDPNETAHFAAPSSREDEEMPEVVGGYRLVRRLGGGGMGSVYEAEDPSSGRHVALKLILPEYAESADAVGRFRQEGRLASSLSHSRCVFVLAADEDAGRPYIVMELMPGTTLDDLIQEKGPLPPQEALAKILDVIDGLDEAHRHGLVHRDVKPSNCFLEADGRVKVGDFGLSKSLVNESKLTRTGTFMGTPLFAAPEQIKMETIDAQSDLYSVAATLYFLLTGRAPFQSSDAMATLARIVSDDPPPMRSVRPDLPRALDKVVLRGLERDRKRRWRDLDEFRRAILPFVPVAPSLGGMGLRLGAYLIDCVILWIVIVVVGTFVIVPIQFRVSESATVSIMPVIQQLIYAVIWLGYNGTMEGVWGWTVGKRLLKLRVGTATGDAPPGLGRALLRAGFFYVMLNLQTWVFYALLSYGTVSIPVPTPGVQPTQEQALQIMVFGFANTAWLALAVTMLVGTMRARNGYRGLHEFISGTRTFRRGWHRATRRQTIRGREIRVEASHPEGVPESVGTYQIRGALRWTADERILLGQDPHLEREVWVWLRPPADAPLDAKQRDVNRNTRVRWLASGLEGEWRWDAFLAAPGARLLEVVASGGRLSWAEARPVLESLAEELTLSCTDDTLPVPLTVHHVWMQPDGSVLLLPLFTAGPDGNEELALSLLRRVAVLALEGGRPDDALPLRVRAPVPGHVTPILERLLGPRNSYATPAEFRAELEATRDRPTTVSRARRFGHLSLMVFMQNFPFLGLMLMLFVPFMAIRHQFVSQNSPTSLETREDAYGIFVVFPLVWIVWAFVFRGGYAYWRGGIVLRRRDGRKATRLQCAFRALLVWVPVAGLLALAVATARLFPELPVVYFGLWGAGALLLPVFAFLAIRSPTRSFHDRIAGTYLVPS